MCILSNRPQSTAERCHQENSGFKGGSADLGIALVALDMGHVQHPPPPSATVGRVEFETLTYLASRICDRYQLLCLSMGAVAPARTSMHAAD